MRKENATLQQQTRKTCPLTQNDRMMTRNLTYRNISSGEGRGRLFMRI
jgi:hypothetical protein